MQLGGYQLLAQVSGVGPALVALVVAASAAETLYYVSSNAYFAAVGDSHARGRQIGVRQAVTAVAEVVAPLTAAWSLVSAGTAATLWVVAAIQMASVAPLFGGPNVAVPERAPMLETITIEPPGSPASARAFM